MIKLTSLGIFILIIIGGMYRKNKEVHAKVMFSAFLLDMLLVLIIEFTRDAVKTAIHPPHPFVLFHVLVSVAVVAFYFFQIVTGWRMLRGYSKSPSWHRRMAVAFLVMRSTNLLTGFFVDHFVH